MTILPKNPISVISVAEENLTEPKTTKASTIMKWCEENYRAILAELFCVIGLIFFPCISCVPIGGVTVPPIIVIMCFGFVVLFNVQAFGHISGAHMNPSVTIASVVYGIMTVTQGIAYIIAQCIGSVIGYGLIVALSPVDVLPEAVCVTTPGQGVSVWQAFGVEVMLTSFLVFVVCSVWDPVNASKTDSIALKFGFCIIGLSIAGASLTGSSMNPARSFGPAVWTGWWEAHWVYWLGPIVGSLLAVFIYKLLWLSGRKVET